MGTLHKDQYTCFIMSRLVLLRMRKVSDKFTEDIKTHIKFNVVLTVHLR